MAANTVWGDWKYDARTFELTFRRNRHLYNVDLDQCRDSAEVLDWIMQVQKNWTTTEDLGHLVEALRDILHPQGSMCSWGRNKRVNPRHIAASRGYDVPPRPGRSRR